MLLVYDTKLSRQALHQNCIKIRVTL